MTLTVYPLRIPQSERIVWLCEDSALNYILKTYDRSPLLAPPEFNAGLRTHDTGHGPVIEQSL
ncbi:hypothetical protein BDW66DRAFT_132432 [Aspergillus desertorum]